MSNNNSYDFHIETLLKCILDSSNGAVESVFKKFNVVSNNLTLLKK